MKEHYYSENQNSKLKIKKINPRLRENYIELNTGSGVFSIGKVDKGTEILINKSIIKDGWRILDLGCGYGAVGITLKKAFPKSKIVMTDVNNRALKLARMNVKENNLDEISVIQGDKFERVKDKFNTILLNPPQSAGKALCFEMIEESKDFLKKNGLLQLVARHNKGGKTLEEKMLDVFGNVKQIAKKSGYRVYVSENK
ncbi:class I SAM-dependent methyltransferase [Candidatus Woesearchaeota archaeon]|nr:class I SAM-dependent methyltransferase [Candidatus Woesearchaeota archaeon]